MVFSSRDFEALQSRHQKAISRFRAFRHLLSPDDDARLSNYLQASTLGISVVSRDSKGLQVQRTIGMIADALDEVERHPAFLSLSSEAASDIHDRASMIRSRLAVIDLLLKKDKNPGNAMLVHNMRNVFATAKGNVLLAEVDVHSSNAEEFLAKAERRLYFLERMARVTYAGRRRTVVVKDFFAQLRDEMADRLQMDPNLLVHRTGKFPSYLRAHFDPDKIFEAVAEIAYNAKKFASGTIEFHYGVERNRSGVPRSFFVRVKDQGFGLSDSLRKHVFTPWMKSLIGQDHGQGLWSLHQTVKKQGGRVGVSEKGTPSEFWLKIPLRRFSPRRFRVRRG